MGDVKFLLLKKYLISEKTFIIICMLSILKKSTIVSIYETRKHQASPGYSQLRYSVLVSAQLTINKTND